MASSIDIARKQYQVNEPEVKPGQIWITGEPTLRRIRILGRYVFTPELKIGEDGRNWIYQEMPGGKMRLEIGRLGILPELNLRYVFSLE